MLGVVAGLECLIVVQAVLVVEVMLIRQLLELLTQVVVEVDGMVLRLLLEQAAPVS